MSAPHLIWTVQAKNPKTGPIPTATVGQTREETWASCGGCPRRPDAAEQLGIPRCYAWSSMLGGPGLTNAQKRAAARPDLHLDVRRALASRLPAARAVRIAAIGDPGRVAPAEVLEAVAVARELGLAVLAYTHHWRTAAHLRPHALASVDTLAGALNARAAGWRVALTVDVEAPAAGPWLRVDDGLNLVVCPEQRGRPVRCNECRLCDPAGPAWRSGKVDGIAFMAHGMDAKGGRSDRRVRALPLAGAAS